MRVYFSLDNIERRTSTHLVLILLPLKNRILTLSMM